MPASSEPRRWKKKKQKPRHDDDVSNDDEDNNINLTTDPAVPEIISGGGVRISDFPAVVRQAVTRYHSSVLSVVAAERAGRNGEGRCGVALENLSHGQLQTVSVVPRDCPLLVPTGEGESADVAAAGLVVSPPRIVSGRGVVKRFGNWVHVVPMHAEWFSFDAVHRLESQIVPHFFTRRSAENTPAKYMECRNQIVAIYLNNPERRLSIADCQEWVTGFETDDLTRVVRFLDHWGIINYCASVPNKEPPNDSSCLREDLEGVVHVPSAALKSIDSLFQFEKSKCKLKAAYIYPSSKCHDHEEADLDSKIREHLSENRCNYCSRPGPVVYYQSQKEADLLLCVDCFNDGRFVTGHSSIDFLRLDTSRDNADLDGESWTNQETLVLLEAIETCNNNWNEIAEHVGSKSKAQCILHFIRLSTEDGLLENVEVPSMFLSSDESDNDLSLKQHSSSNGDSAGSCIGGPDLESELPFANSANPVMTLVAFLTSAVGPRVAAACAQTSLAVLSEDSEKAVGQREESGVNMRADVNVTHNNEGCSHGEVAPLSSDKVKAAAKAGLAAAATKAKLFADHEEREIQRLSASIVNYQIKRLELKLKQFAEMENFIVKECEQIGNTRQRLAGERARLMSLQFENAVGTSSMMPPGINNTTFTPNQFVGTASSQQFISPAYNLNQQFRPQFMGRQQMYGLGPRLPRSALHQSYNNPANNAQPSPSYPLMRSVSGNRFGLG